MFRLRLDVQYLGSGGCLGWDCGCVVAWEWWVCSNLGVMGV